MSKRDAGLLMEDMREAMDKIARYTAGMDRSAAGIAGEVGRDVLAYRRLCCS
jgi:uncharacterized protein with HEPN domain